MPGRFRGHLFLPGEVEDSLQAIVELEDDQVSVTANQQSLGTWALDDCSFEKVGGDTYRLTLSGEVVYFEPEEPLSFAAVLSPVPTLAERFRQVQAAPGRPRHAAPRSTVGGSLVSVVEWIKAHRLTAGALVVSLLAVLVGAWLSM